MQSVAEQGMTIESETQIERQAAKYYNKKPKNNPGARRFIGHLWGDNRGNRCLTPLPPVWSMNTSGCAARAWPSKPDLELPTKPQLIAAKASRTGRVQNVSDNRKSWPRRCSCRLRLRSVKRTPQSIPPR